MKPLCMKRILILLTLLAEAWNASAKVTLPEQICDNMVLQQNASVRLWGWAGPHAAVHVAASWGSESSATCDGAGHWEVRLATPAGSYEPQRVTISDGEIAVLDNVLIGEVWLARYILPNLL